MNQVERGKNITEMSRRKQTHEKRVLGYLKESKEFRYINLSWAVVKKIYLCGIVKKLLPVQYYNITGKLK